MKITPIAICILSVGLSLATLSEAKNKDHHHIKHPSHHHKHADHSHHNHANHHHHNAPAAIPHVPYYGHDDSRKHRNEEPKVDNAPQTTPSENPLVITTPEADHEHKQTFHSKNLAENAPIPRRTEKMVVAYWTDWTSDSMPPEAIPFDKVTHINYAFAIVRPDFRPVFETDHLLNRVVREAHAKGVKVLMSIGGWTGSQYFSPMAATKQGRKTFIDGAVHFVQKYNLDGIDIDWQDFLVLYPSMEYPGRLGSACNTFDEKNDANNFLILLQELRAAFHELPRGDQLEISLATRIVPFDGPNGQMTDVSEFAKVVNHINVMAYDINGSWGSVTGANAPLAGNGLTYESGASAWINAGFPAEQINMGVPFYGRSLITKQDMSGSHTMAAPFDSRVPVGDDDDGLWTDPCEKTAAYSGVWKFRNLREQRVIDAQGHALAPWIRKFDLDSMTPWLFNPQTKQFISYDDRKSLRLKVLYAREKKLGGVMLWAINQDTADFELLNVLQDVRA
ncbi:hypothetical protein BG006_010052 [Podila minutissima]|uniref:GH18 domain-containing protein n=1 Tax=Podila minutissima TaxID=64525 RepID=A0A9P5SUQ8_9FUNG|nr:hypothetical protein BG006_010052 [Podila minutissima]